MQISWHDADEDEHLFITDGELPKKGDEVFIRDYLRPPHNIRKALVMRSYHFVTHSASSTSHKGEVSISFEKD